MTTRGPHRRIAAQDGLWLDLDRPDNRMSIVSVLWTATPIEPANLRRVIADRLVGRYPVYSQRPVTNNGLVGSPYWETDPDFDLDRHVVVDRLPNPGTKSELQDFAAAQRGRAFDFRHPLWSAHLLQGYGQGSAVVLRSHHAMADGIRLTQVMFSLFDPLGAQASAPPKVGGAGPHRPEPVHPSARLTAAGLRVVDDVGARLRTTASRVGPAAEMAVALPVLGAATATAAVGAVADSLASVLPADGRRLTDSAAASAMTFWHSAGSAWKLLAAAPVEDIWPGGPGVEKTAVWGDPVPLASVKRISQATGTTVNDVCVALVTGAVGRYLSGTGAEAQDVPWMIPVSLEAFDADLPETLGNHFSLVLASLPSTGRSFRERLAQVHKRVARIRDSYQPVLTFGLQQVISQTPASVAAGMTRYFADKAIGVLTNVPGPRAPMALAGARVDGVVGWAPCSGKQALTVCVFSYADQVFFGFGSDRRMIPDPERLVMALDAEVAAVKMTSQEVLGQ